ncbi:alanine--glyoxylate aminotransferase family protein [Siminovitchia sp. FSL H7-0308]|uniref:Aspartate aminotransferase-like enzyme n=1 Tax=Siminovitchia thermophila TaxID=1245522 RepID=A0ABS2RAD3_9BACI|nr:alanine--glyoxylate aminotransferase family protein [Siminovitchia thermophila]MBM7716549.1 aspartate aminotransferase-like enzyme [Siminovitchia thermophila]ONK24111.1 class V aminotransferase [Bacillus sp. VT-16-64]
MYKLILRHPGPTPIPKKVNMAMSQDIISHRSPEFIKLFRETTARIKPLFGTEQDVLLLAASGTAALEAAAVNAVSPGEKVVVISIGAFGDYFAAICEKYGFDVHKLQKTWGEACTPEELEAFLKPLNNIKAVFATYCETSTGVLNPIEDLAKIVKKNTDALFIVDGVSCIGAVPAKMDEWGIDILATGSQKALMLPPGLALISVSEQAWKAIENNQTPVYYLNLLTYRDWFEQGMTPNTSAVTLIYGLSAVCDLIEEETFARTVERHELMKKMVKEAMNALDIDLLASEPFMSPTVTAIRTPKYLDLEQFLQLLKQKYHLDFAGGLGSLQGQIFRFGHMGYCFPADVLEAVSLMEAGLKELSYPFEMGAGVKAAADTLSATKADIQVKI